jgi:hypothetical protein
MNDEQRLRALEQQLADLRARLPKHSIPAAMILQLESLEDEIERLRLQPQTNSSTSQTQKQAQ